MTRLVSVLRRLGPSALVASLLLAPLTPAIAATPPAAYTGLKKTVAVDAFGGADLTTGAADADSLAAILTDVLIKDGRFVVVERPALAAVQTEQQLGTSGAATSETAAKTGQLIGARLLIKGAITKFNPAAGGGGLSMGGLPGGKLLGLGGDLKTATATVSISLRLIDTTTGQIIATVNAAGAASNQTADAGVINRMTGQTAGANAFRATPLAKAMEDAIRKAVRQINPAADSVAWSGMVIDNRDGQVYLNAGAEQNVQSGMVFSVFRKGEALTDPGTGAVLDVAMTTIGTVKVGEVRAKISIATIQDGQPPARGDFIKAP